MAALIFSNIAGSTVAMLWAFFACVAIFFINPSWVLSLADHVQSIPKSLQANDGMLITMDEDE